MVIMKQLFLTTALFVVAVGLAFTQKQNQAQSPWKSQQKNISYGFELSTGFESAFTSEYVYYKESGDVMSRLDWNAPFSPKIALGGNLNVFHAVLGADFEITVPIRCGSMEDWDYLKDDHSRATNYSTSDLIVNKNYEFEIKGGYEFLISNFRILPEAGFKYKNQKMEASGGYLQYGSLDSSEGGYWSSNLKKYDLTGTVITYEQQFFMPFVLLNLEYKFLNDWTGKIFFRYYPSIRCDAIDMHNERMTQFNDFMTGGKGFALGTKIQWKDWELSFTYEWLKCDEGNTTQRNFGHTTYLSDSDSEPGTESEIFKLLVTYHIK